MTDDFKRPKSESGFTSLSGVLDNLQDTLFSGLQILPDDIEEIPQPPQKELSETSRELGETGREITAGPNKVKKDGKTYLARQVVQCSLPRSDPGNQTVFVRRNGNVSLVLEALTDPETMQTVGLPSGSIAKILWLWINTEAVFNKNSLDTENKYRLRPGRTLNAFLLSLRLKPNTGGGKFSHAKTVRDELTKLLRCHISFHQSEGDGTRGRKSFVNMPIARSASLWWDFKNPDQAELFESEIILDEVFFEAITAAPVPVDMKIVVALMRSPLAIDVYTWAAYRVHVLEDAGQCQVEISVAALKEQFGAEYKRVDHFKAAFGKALEKVKKEWPTLNYTFTSKSLILRTGNTKTAIPKRNQKFRNPALDIPDRLSSAMREKFQTTYPVHNVDEVFDAFDIWRTNKGIVSQNTDAHFWNFVTKQYFKR